MSVGDPGFEPGTMASMDKFRLFYLTELIALPVFPGCQYQKQIIVCLPPGGNILNLILPCSCLPDHCKRQGLPLLMVCGCRSEARVTPWISLSIDQIPL